MREVVKLLSALIKKISKHTMVNLSNVFEIVLKYLKLDNRQYLNVETWLKLLNKN